MHAIELHDAVQAHAAELGGVRQHDDFPGPLHHLVIQARFRLVVGGHPKLQYVDKLLLDKAAEAHDGYP